jgi:hypothetical protein
VKKKVICAWFDAVGTFGPAPSILQKITRGTEGRDAVPEDWDGVCYNKCEKTSGIFLVDIICAATGVRTASATLLLET